MLKKYLTNIKIVCLYTVALFSMNAYASFGGGYLCGSGNLACDFVVIWVGFGLLRGGIPISILIFLGLHICLCNRERSKKNQAWLGALNSIIAFGVASFGAALMAWVGRNNIEIGFMFVFVYVLFAIISIRYVRSSPRS